MPVCRRHRRRSRLLVSICRVATLLHLAVSRLLRPSAIGRLVSSPRGTRSSTSKSCSRARQSQRPSRRSRHTRCLPSHVLRSRRLSRVHSRSQRSLRRRRLSKCSQARRMHHGVHRLSTHPWDIPCRRLAIILCRSHGRLRRMTRSALLWQARHWQCTRVLRAARQPRRPAHPLRRRSLAGLRCTLLAQPMRRSTLARSPRTR